MSPASAPEAPPTVGTIDADGELIREHLGGAQGAFDLLYQRYFPRLVRYCIRSARDRSTAEDVAQEALVRALVHLHRFDVDRPLWPWLKTIASRVLIDHARDRAREVPSERPNHDAAQVEPGGLEERPILAEALS